MKTITTLAALFLALFISIPSNSFAAPPAEMPFTTTAGARSYGLRNIAHFGGSISASSMLYGSRFTDSFWIDWDEGPDPDALLKTIKDSRFKVELSNPEGDIVYYQVWFYNEDFSQTLFSIRSSFSPELVQCRWILPAWAFKVDMVQSPTVSVPFKDAVYAQLISDDGRILDSFNGEDGFIEMPTNLDSYENIGQFLVYTYNPRTNCSETFAYSLKNGKRIIGTPFQGKFDSSGIEGVLIIKAQELGDIEIPSEDGIGKTPLISTRIKFRGSYIIDISTSEGKYPTSITVEKIGGIKQKHNVRPATGNRVILTLEPGLYEIIPTFKWEDLHEDPIPDDDDGGLG